MRSGLQVVPVPALFDFILIHAAPDDALSGLHMSSVHNHAALGRLFAQVAQVGDADGRIAGEERRVFHLAEDQPLIHQPPKGLRRGNVPKIEEHLMPEARVEQM